MANRVEMPFALPSSHVDFDAFDAAVHPGEVEVMRFYVSRAWQIAVESGLDLNGIERAAWCEVVYWSRCGTPKQSRLALLEWKLWSDLLRGERNENFA